MVGLFETVGSSEEREGSKERGPLIHEKKTKVKSVRRGMELKWMEKERVVKRTSEEGQHNRERICRRKVNSSAKPLLSKEGKTHQVTS